jgi:hypothetical protein
MYAYMSPFIFILFVSNLRRILPKRLSENNDDFLYIININTQRILNETLSNRSLEISEYCRDYLNYTYIYQKNADYYIYKTFEDSSKNKNDVGSYNDCMINKFSGNPSKSCEVKDFTYLIVAIEKQEVIEYIDTKYQSETYLFGLCVAIGCTEKDYAEIFYDVNSKIDNPFNLTSKNELTIYDVKKNQEIPNMIGLYLIPFYFLLIQIIFVLFPEIPSFLFKNCFKKKNVKKNDSDDKGKPILDEKDENSKGSINGKQYNDNDSNREGKRNIFTETIGNNKSSHISNINKTRLFKFNSAFNAVENSEDLFSKKPTYFNNDSGLHYSRGIRSISMFFLIFGNTFMVLFDSPLKIYEESAFVDLHKNLLYTVLFIGIRYAPRVLFSCSGFTYIYKLLSFLEDKDEFSTNNTDSYKVNKSAEFKNFLKFILKQFYKYVIYVFVILFFRYSLYPFIFMITNVGPLSVYYKLRELDHLCWRKTLSRIFLLSPYIYDTDTILDFFWMSLNEITFFIISTLIIYLFYRKKSRFDLFFLILFVFLVLGKFALWISPLHNYYPTVYYYNYYYGLFFINPLFNYTYYIIGIFFGLVNFCLQNNITKRKTAYVENKTYLLSAIKFIKLFNKRSRLFYAICCFLCLIIISICCFATQISLSIIGSDDNLKSYFRNPFLNIWFLIDVEIVVFLINFLAFSLFLIGVNIFLDLLSNQVWLSFSRSYFSYILLSNPLILFNLYQSESRIQLNFMNIFFYSFTFWLLNVFLAWLFYISFEFPFKRINKIILEENKTEDNLDDSEQ